MPFWPVASTQPSKKSRAPPVRGPTPLAERGKETFLDKRKKEASLDERDVCIDYHNVLEKREDPPFQCEGIGMPEKGWVQGPSPVLLWAKEVEG